MPLHKPLEDVGAYGELYLCRGSRSVLKESRMHEAVVNAMLGWDMCWDMCWALDWYACVTTFMWLSFHPWGVVAPSGTSFVCFSTPFL